MGRYLKERERERDREMNAQKSDVLSVGHCSCFHANKRYTHIYIYVDTEIDE